MIVKGFFGDPNGAPRLAGDVVFRAGNSSGVVFVIDTGATRTILPRRFVEQSGVNLSSYQRRVRTEAVGAETALLLWQAQIVLESSDHRFWFDVEVGVPEQEPSGNTMSALLGRDVLRHMKIVLDQRKNLVSCEPYAWTNRVSLDPYSKGDAD